MSDNLRFAEYMDITRHATGQKQLVDGRRRRYDVAMSSGLGPFSFAAVMDSRQNVHQRLIRATAALNAASVRYAVAGGNAVAAWVSRVDPGAVRATQDVDILLSREEFAAAKASLESAGFIHRHVAGLDIFLDGLTGRARDAVHIIFANEKVRPEEPIANPGLTEIEPAEGYFVLSLEPLVRVKLTAFRDKDRTHLRDMIDVGLIDATWPARLPSPLGDRLQVLLDTPNG